MDVHWWLSESVERIRSDGRRGVRWAVEKPYYKLLQQHAKLRDPGRHVYEADWDLLVVVDACRLDLMREVADEYDYVTAVGEWRSINSVTRRWMEANFGSEFAEETARTAYVSGNPWSADLLDEATFGHVSHVWEHAWVDPGTVPPEAVTDETIRVAREGSYDRVVAHYMQPHCPFLSDPSVGPGKQLDRFGDQPEGDVWDALRRGEVAKEEVWSAYRDNLRIALDDVGRLLRNVDAPRTVVTSDHGNALGEWGVYGHHPDMGLDCLRTVPWVETTAEDTGEVVPDPVRTEHELSREEQLRDLGYL